MTESIVHPWEREYGEIQEFFINEADLLDRGEFRGWLQLLHPEVVYQMPVRVTRGREQAEDTLSDMTFYEETFRSLTHRVERLETGYAWAEDPPSRTRHFVTNLKVYRTAVENQRRVVSNLLVVRSRGDQSTSETLVGEREDLLVRTAEGWKLLRRQFVPDQVVLGMTNLSVFV
jgi:PAH dioxygenase small subunit